MARQQHMMEQAGVNAQLLGSILTPPELDLTYPERSSGHSRGERVSIVIVVTLMLMAVFIGMSYIFASITGEKQIRVTEQVVSAIPAQAWIDGKILGLIAVSIVGVVGQVLAFAAVYLLLQVFLDAPALPLPSSLGHPGVVALIFLYGVLGLFFWFAFLGAVAATIDDPHTSARGSLLFIPMFASGMAFFVLRDAESGASRAFALLPPTAPSAMPVRLLMTEVGALELALSLGLLVGAIMLLRIAAGRIFRIAMLMYGKEPTWAELRRWSLGK
jgi:ABC-2 type transport system permease protein